MNIAPELRLVWNMDAHEITVDGVKVRMGNDADARAVFDKLTALSNLLADYRAYRLQVDHWTLKIQDAAPRNNLAPPSTGEPTE
jgi:hypothetical protein